MDDDSTLYVFPTAIGWMAMETNVAGLKRIVFAHRSRQQALLALTAGAKNAPVASADHPLIERLQNYADGAPEDFRDVTVDYGVRPVFQLRVLEQCRQIPPGETISYGELARRAGSPKAARAVGQVMATNRVPIVIPCHRVVASGSRIGGFSAPGGLDTKRRLLALEAECRSLVTIAGQQ